MPFNFPAPLPAKRFSDGLSYPLNLKADNREYFTRIEFIKYRPALFGMTLVEAVQGLARQIPNFTVPSEFATRLDVTINSGETVMGSAIHLPIPKKINEMNMMNWSEISLTGVVLDAMRSAAVQAGYAAGDYQGAGIAGSLFDTAQGLSRLIGAAQGIQINPFILQFFQRPSFREFSFTWTLAPRNKKESEQINLIIRQIKAAQAPRRAAGGFIMEYPDLAVVKFNPQDEFQVELKECVIVGVNVDYTPAGGPSYINRTAAPTMVNLTIHLKETLLWWSEEWGGSAGTFETPQGPAEDSSPPTVEENPLPNYGEGDGAIYGPGGLTN